MKENCVSRMRGWATERRKGVAGGQVRPFVSAALSNAGDAMNDHCLGAWWCIIPQNWIRSFLCVFLSSLMSALVPGLAVVCMEVTLKPWPGCCRRSFLPQVMLYLSLSSPAHQAGKRSFVWLEVCHSYSLAWAESNSPAFVQAYIWVFFHFRVAVTFYPYLQGRVRFRDIGVVACSVSEVMKFSQVWTRTSLAQSCPIYGLCLAGPTAVETF